MQSVPIPYATGKKKRKYHVLKLQEEYDSTILETSFSYYTPPKKKLKKQEHKLPTLESALSNKKTISNDKCKTFKQQYQELKSTMILDLELTSKEKTSLKFWNSSTKIKSQSLWSATKIDSADLDLKCWNGSLKNTIQNSWFSTKVMTRVSKVSSVKTSWQSPPSLWRAITDAEQLKTAKEEDKRKKSQKKEKLESQILNNKKPQHLKVRKLRIYPTADQKVELSKWMGAARWTYNQVVATLRQRNKKEFKKVYRDLFINKDSKAYQENEWLKDTQYDVRDEALRDVMKAIKTTQILCKNKDKPFHFTRFKFRSKKKGNDSIVVRGRDWNRKRGIFSKVLSPKVLKCKTSLPEKITHSFRVVRDTLCRYWICIPIPIEVRSENQAPKSQLWNDQILSIDPGIRTFATCYDPSGKVYEFGRQDVARLYRLSLHLDELYFKRKKSKAKTRWRLKWRTRRLEQRISNLAKEAHRKIARWMCSNYRVILLPTFEVSKMVKKSKRKLSKFNVRKMMRWGHYAFREHLLHKSKEFPWCKVVICDEHYTSKTCGGCGFLHYGLGKKKDFNCPQCRFYCDRDVNGARNILLRYLTLNKI